MQKQCLAYASYGFLMLVDIDEISHNKHYAYKREQALKHDIVVFLHLAVFVSILVTTFVAENGTTINKMNVRSPDTRKNPSGTQMKFSSGNSMIFL